jgi:hypothetical protein
MRSRESYHLAAGTRERNEFDARTDVVEAQAQVNDARTDVFEAQAQVNDARTDVFEAQAQVNDARTDVVEAQAQVNDARTDVFEAQAQVNDARTDVFEAQANEVSCDDGSMRSRESYHLATKAQVKTKHVSFVEENTTAVRSLVIRQIDAHHWTDKTKGLELAATELCVDFDRTPISADEQTYQEDCLLQVQRKLEQVEELGELTKTRNSLDDVKTIKAQVQMTAIESTEAYDDGVKTHKEGMSLDRLKRSWRNENHSDTYWLRRYAGNKGRLLLYRMAASCTPDVDDAVATYHHHKLCMKVYRLLAEGDTRASPDNQKTTKRRTARISSCISSGNDNQLSDPMDLHEYHEHLVKLAHVRLTINYLANRTHQGARLLDDALKDDESLTLHTLNHAFVDGTIVMQPVDAAEEDPNKHLTYLDVEVRNNKDKKLSQKVIRLPVIEDSGSAINIISSDLANFLGVEVLTSKVSIRIRAVNNEITVCRNECRLIVEAKGVDDSGKTAIIHYAG